MENNKKIIKDFVIEYENKYKELKKICNMSSSDNNYDENKVRKTRIELNSNCWPTTKFEFNTSHIRKCLLNNLYHIWYIYKHNLNLEENRDKLINWLKTINYYYLEGDYLNYRINVLINQGLHIIEHKK